MADKKLLEESTIRRFMQLANIKPTEAGVLSESVVAEGDREQAGGGHTPFAGGRKAGEVAGLSEKKKKHKRMEQEDLEETVQEEDLEEAHGYEEGLEEAEGEEGGEDMEAPEMAGDEMGAESEGGDLEAAVEQLVSAMNGVLAAAGMGDKTVELDSGEGEDMEAGEPEMGGEKSEPMMEAEDVAEDLEESIELVDDTLVEKLLQRVSARLVAEARKSRELAESKTGWGKHGMHTGNQKKKTIGRKPKAKSGTPFTKKMSTKGLANR